MQQGSICKLKQEVKAIVLAVGAETLESKTGLFVDIETDTGEPT